MRKTVYTLETTLTPQQITRKLEELKHELKDDYSIMWNRKRDKFVARKKLHGFLRKFPIRIYVKGKITQPNNVTKIGLSLSPGMNLKDLIIFAIPTFSIMLFTGELMDVGLVTISTVFVIVTILVFLLTYIESKFTQIGKDLCEETFDMLERQLCLNK